MIRLTSVLTWIWGPLVLVVDYLTKLMVLANRDILMQRVEVIGDFARFIYVRNSGAAMGIFPGGRIFLVTVSLLMAIVLVFVWRKISSENKVQRAALSAIWGGAVGNLIDRVFYDGLVVDFIDLGIGTHRFFTFNVADIGVSIGGAVLFVSLWLSGDKK
ncbi:signal peptidase II [bacterium]|nr:signal peptidase II [bacterium]